MDGSPDINETEQNLKYYLSALKNQFMIMSVRLQDPVNWRRKSPRRFLSGFGVKWDPIDEIENIDFYIFRIARNECMRYFKKAAVETHMFQDLQKRMTSENNNVSEYINYKETEGLLDKAIASLSPQRQKVYLLSRRQGLRIEEIAAEMQISYNTVRNHLVEALRQIRHYYIEHLSIAVLLISHFLMIS